MINIMIRKAASYSWSTPQLWGYRRNRPGAQASKFAGQEMCVIERTGKPERYILRYLDFMSNGFCSMEYAKEHAPRFAKMVLAELSDLIEDEK